MDDDSKYYGGTIKLLPNGELTQWDDKHTCHTKDSNFCCHKDCAEPIFERLHQSLVQTEEMLTKQFEDEIK